MGRFRATIASLAAGLVTLTTVSPAAAAGPVGQAYGSVTWALRGGEVPGIVSTFNVVDGKPGQHSTKGDDGTYTLTRAGDLPGSLELDVQCVRVNAGWAEFAGTVFNASGIYVDGEVFLVSVKDGGASDEIGMASHGTEPIMTDDGTVRTAIERGCAAALDGKQYKRQGVISGGDITVLIS